SYSATLTASGGTAP
ncbi:hypothetical protein, partial [Aeromonas bestiarum]